MEISWFADLTATTVLITTLIGLVVVVFGVFYGKRESLIRMRWIGIGFLMMFLLVAYTAGVMHGARDMSGVPVALENLSKDEVFSVVDAMKGRDKNLALIKGETMSPRGLLRRRDGNEGAARIVTVTLEGLPAPGKSFFLKEINGKVIIFPIPNP